MLEKFKGTGVALVTPFNENLEIDYQGFENVLRHTADGGVDYWVVQGTTGESPTLNKEEKKQVLKFTKSHNPKGLPIVYGIGGNYTQEILQNIEETDFEGVDALLSVSPYYNKPSQNGIYEHYIKIADKSPVPVILYNVPGRTAANMTAQTTLRLAEHKNIIAMKEASGNIEQCIAIAKNKPKDFLLLSGDDMLCNSITAIGGEGVISVLANAFPFVFTSMVNAGLKNDFQTANHFLHQLFDINPLMYEESNPVGVKQALELLGVCKNHVRLPLIPASDSLKHRIESVMQNSLATI